jgi:hypothetical protein
MACWGLSSSQRTLSSGQQTVTGMLSALAVIQSLAHHVLSAEHNFFLYS